MSEPVNTPDHDIIIAGGGPVGSALALALADGRRRIAVVEATSGSPAGGARATVLANGTVRLLDALGTWSGLAAGAVPIHRVEVSQRGRFGRTRINSAEEGVAALGQVVAHGDLARSLAVAAQAAPGVDWIAPARVVGAATGARVIGLELETTDGKAVRGGRLAVAADGTGSPLRTALGIPVTEHDYGQVALLARLETGGDPYTAHERFAEDGTLALLPGGGRRRTLIWSAPIEAAERLASLSAEAFTDEVASRLGVDFAPVTLLDGPQQYPLRRVEATRPVTERAVVVGNAARTLHPVAAQGFNLALRDACALAERLLVTDDPGDPEVLAGWRRARRTDQWLTRAFTDLLARGFGHGPRVLAGVRAGALVGVDLCPAARHALSAQTMGLVEGLPRVGRWRLREGA